MKRILFAILFLFSRAAFGQASGQVRTLASKADLVARVPVVGERVVVSYDYGARTFTAVSTLPSGGTNVAHVFASGATNKWWVSDDVNVRPQNAKWWGLVGDGVTDNSANFAAMLAHSRDIELPRGRYAMGTPVSITNAESISIVSRDGSYQGGWHSTNLVTKAEFLYIGPTTNIFFDFTPGIDAGSGRQMLRLGNRVENVSFNANGLADVSVRIGYLGRGRFIGCRFNGGTGVNWLLNASQFCTFIDCSTSQNEDQAYAVTPRYGMSLTNFSPANVFIDCQWEKSSEIAVLFAPNAKNNVLVGGAIEANQGDGLILESSATGNSFNGIWFEANGGTNSIWVKSGAIQNTFDALRMYEDNTNGALRVAGSYNSFKNFGAHTIWIEPSGTRNKWENMIYVATNGLIDQTAGGQMFVDMINAEATIRTNTLSSPFVQYGEPFKLWNGTNLYERVRLRYDGIYFGDGSNPPDVGWTRLSSASLATTNALVFLPQGVNDSLLAAYAPGDAQPRVRLSVNQTLAFGPGGSSTVDTTLRRLSAETLLTESAVLSLRTNVGHLGVGVGITNDAATRVALLAGGRIVFGDGAGPQTASIAYDSVGTIRLTTNLVVDGAITLGGVARTTWPSGSGGTNSSRVFWGGAEVDDPNFVSSATVERVAASGVTNLAFQVVDASIASNKLASASVTPDKLTDLTSADLRGKVSDESGTGVLLFGGGDIGAATATTPSADDNDTSVATTAFYQAEEAALKAANLWQASNVVLTAHAANNLAGGTNLSATTAFSSGTVPIARLASGTPDGTKFIRDDGTLATPSGGGGGNASTNVAQGWSAAQTFNAPVVINTNLTISGDLAVNSITAANGISVSDGGTGATNAAGARTSLGLVLDQDVQAYRLPLLQFHFAMAATGDMPYRNSGGIITNATSTTAGRALLTAADAAAQRTALGLGTMALETAANYALLAGATFTGDISVPDEAYDATAWNGSLEAPTKNAIRDKIESLPGGTNFISTISSDFEVVTGELRVTNTVGTGRIVRESAAGGGSSNAVRFLFSAFAKDFVSGTNAAAQALDVVVGNGRRFARFSPSTDNERLFEGVIPPQANLAGGLKVTLHFGSTNTAGNAVVWQVQLAPGTGTDPTTTTWLTAVKLTNALPGSIAITNASLNYADLAGITNRQPIIGRVLRDQGNASDTETGNADLRAVVLEILDSN